MSEELVLASGYYETVNGDIACLNFHLPLSNSWVGIVQSDPSNVRWWQYDGTDRLDRKFTLSKRVGA